MSRRDDIFQRSEEFLTVFRRGAEFTKELVEENQRLRRQILEVDQRDTDAARDPTEWNKLREHLLTKIEGLEAEKEDVLQRVQALEDENRQFANRYVEIEEENNNLANLYVASYQLHSTLDLSEVLKIIIEIVINLVGAEIFCVYVHDEKTSTLEPVASEGEVVSAFPSTPLGRGIIGGSVETGDTHSTDSNASADYETPIVSIPLRVEDRPIGAIAIFKLLAQKERFTPLDHELFTLLAGHAATAIFAAELHAQSERKLNTIQGFLDLLAQ